MITTIPAQRQKRKINVFNALIFHDTVFFFSMHNFSHWKCHFFVLWQFHICFFPTVCHNRYDYFHSLFDFNIWMLKYSIEILFVVSGETYTDSTTVCSLLDNLSTTERINSVWIFFSTNELEYMLREGPMSVCVWCGWKIFFFAASFNV